MKYCTDLILGKDFLYLSSFISQITDFLYCMVCIFIFDGATVKTENTENIYLILVQCYFLLVVLLQTSVTTTTSNPINWLTLHESSTWRTCVKLSFKPGPKKKKRIEKKKKISLIFSIGVPRRFNLHMVIWVHCSGFPYSCNKFEYINIAYQSFWSISGEKSL